MSKVAFVKTEDRMNGVKSSIATLGLNPVKNKAVFYSTKLQYSRSGPGFNAQ
jgi:hypothetical protein